MVLPFLAPLAPFAPIIGAGISAVGSIFSANAARNAGPQVVRNEVDYKKMVKSAEAAGFNPLTVLRNGGSAGFGVQTHPALSSVSPIGEGLQAIGGGIAAFQWDPLADMRAQAEYALVQAQLENIQADTAMRSRSFGAPSYQGSTTMGVSGSWQTPQPNEPMRVFGVDIAGNPNYSPAGVLTENWGEPAEWLYAPVKMTTDIFHHFRGQMGENAPTFHMDKLRADIARSWGGRDVASGAVDFARWLDNQPRIHEPPSFNWQKARDDFTGWLTGR